MSHQADDHPLCPNGAPADRNAHARKPWRAPLVISASAARAEKWSHETFEGGSYPTTHGPS